MAMFKSIESLAAVTQLQYTTDNGAPQLIVTYRRFLGPLADRKAAGEPVGSGAQQPWLVSSREHQPNR